MIAILFALAYAASMVLTYQGLQRARESWALGGIAGMVLSGLLLGGALGG